MKSKRGSAIAEAAIVFPVIVIALLTVIYILIVLYTDASEGARDRIALRHESGMKTATVERQEGILGITPDDRFGRKPFHETAEIFEGIRLIDKILLTDRSRVYIVNEAEHIRKVDFLQSLGGVE